jgi:hypothetical protein
VPEARSQQIQPHDAQVGKHLGHLGQA